jgi:hypothetical protein
MWEQPPSAVQQSEASAPWFGRKELAAPTRRNYSGFDRNLLSQARTDHKLSSILGEENLPDSMPQAAFRAGLHFGLFDDLCAALHVDARLRALILVK